MTNVSLREIDNEGRILIATRASPASIASQVSVALGISLPVDAGQSERGDATALCFGPGEWLLLTPVNAYRRILRALEDCLSDTVSHVADVTSAKTGFEVRGHGARDLLTGLCPLDLHPAIFAPGQCARSLLVRIPVSVFHSNEQSAYQLYVDRSLAAYAHDWLADGVALAVDDRSS